MAQYCLAGYAVLYFHRYRCLCTAHRRTLLGARQTDFLRSFVSDETCLSSSHELGAKTNRHRSSKAPTLKAPTLEGTNPKRHQPRKAPTLGGTSPTVALLIFVAEVKKVGERHDKVQLTLCPGSTYREGSGPGGTGRGVPSGRAG